MNKTVINIKIDKSLKDDAQKTARELGLPLGTIVNAYLRDLVNERRVVFTTHPVPNKKTQMLLRSMEKDRDNSYGPFDHKSAVSFLDNL